MGDLGPIEEDVRFDHEAAAELRRLCNAAAGVIEGQRERDERNPASAQIAEALPLLVREVAVTDPVLTLSGDDWSLTVWCPFRVTGLDFDWESPDLEDRAWDLVGHRVEQLTVEAGGPVFGLSGGAELVLDEAGDDDPWVLRIPGAVITGGTRSPHWD